ncbi:MAG: archaemetzincin family Zn-dependent metalloprotease [Anaerolineae bacterium]|nr:archaemetzincin family Zn-dependent metalloprotease [Anaerolineae bacterium]
MFSSPKEILLITIGEIDTTLIEELSKSLSTILRLRCRLGHISTPPLRAYDPSRGQYLADAVLANLHPGEAERVLGIVEVDIFMPDLNFVFGLADEKGKRAIISLARLKESFYKQPEDQSLLIERAIKEALHEVGHTYGLAHCRTRRCVMAFSNSVVDVDYKDADFCYSCKQSLRA